MLAFHIVFDSNLSQIFNKTQKTYIFENSNLFIFFKIQFYIYIYIYLKFKNCRMLKIQNSKVFAFHFFLQFLNFKMLQ